MLEVVHMVPPQQSARSYLLASILALLPIVIAPTLPAADRASARVASEASSLSGAADETGLTRQPDVDSADERTFRLSRSEGKPSLIHPDGQPFVALGVNHIGMLASDREFFAKRYNGDWNRFREHLGQQFDRWNMNCVGYGARRLCNCTFHTSRRSRWRRSRSTAAIRIPIRQTAISFPILLIPTGQRMSSDGLARCVNGTAEIGC